MTCEGIPYHHMPCNVLDRDSEAETSHEGEDQARDGKYQIDAASNRANRATCARFFEIIESDLSTRILLGNAKDEISHP